MHFARMQPIQPMHNHDGILSHELFLDGPLCFDPGTPTCIPGGAVGSRPLKKVSRECRLARGHPLASRRLREVTAFAVRGDAPCPSSNFKNML
jgi:hypothetical protein